MFTLLLNGQEYPPVVATIPSLLVSYGTVAATPTATATATVGNPAINSFTINTLGTTATIVFNQAMVKGVNYDNNLWGINHFTTASSITYTSGNNTATWVYAFNLPVLATDDCDTNITFSTVTGDDIESVLNGTDLTPNQIVSGNAFPCTNNSIQ